MKAALSLLLIGLLGARTAFCQEVGKQEYTGAAEIADLGGVVFPPGKWQLEFRIPSPQPNPASQPDYFGFRKVGEPIERLGFRRYSPEIAPDKLINVCDGVMESLGLGSPLKLITPRNPDPNAMDGEVEVMRFYPELSQIKPDTREIFLSFITKRFKGPQTWLCHAHIYSQDRWVYVVFHSSTAVLDPEIVGDVQWRSPEHAK